ncbi:MAG: hypothetical protein LBG48_00395, partial [Rickettsiales bacterium]|nr:hypothetical protein [Rickettsiales bacterium]
MFRKMFFNLFTILVLSTVVIIACIAKQKIGLIKNFFEENKKIEIIQKFVEKKYVYIDPDVKDFIIPDIVAVKRFVYLLNKNGWILIPQKTFSVLHEIKIDNSITLTEEQISGKISYKKLNMQLYPNLIGKGFDSKEIATKREKIESFDNDLDIYVFGEYKIKKDIFKQLNNNTLVNSVEINNPQIGDIKMEYEIFSPNYV